MKKKMMDSFRLAYLALLKDQMRKDGFSHVSRGSSGMVMS